MKKRGRQTFCKYISKLVMGRNKLDLKITFENPLTHKMIVHLDVFCASMEDKI